MSQRKVYKCMERLKGGWTIITDDVSSGWPSNAMYNVQEID